MSAAPQCGVAKHRSEGTLGGQWATESQEYTRWTPWETHDSHLQSLFTKSYEPLQKTVTNPEIVLQKQSFHITKAIFSYEKQSGGNVLHFSHLAHCEAVQQLSKNEWLFSLVWP